MFEPQELLLPLVFWLAVYGIHARFGNKTKYIPLGMPKQGVRSTPKMYAISVWISFYLILCLAYLQSLGIQQSLPSMADLQWIAFGFAGLIVLHLAILRDQL